MAVLLAGCAGTPEVVPDPVRVSPTVTALGVASAKDVDLARRVSEARAIKNLARLLAPDAVAFELRSAAGHSTLTLTLAPTEIKPEATEFIDKIKTSWVAKATGRRSPEALAAMQKLTPITAEVEAGYPDPSVALLKAENRAFRRVIARAAGIDEDAVLLTGKLTVIALDEQVEAESAQVSLSAAVTITDRKPLPDDQKAALFEEAVKEHRSLQEWPRAVAALERLVAVDGATAMRWAEIGELQGLAGRHGRAADAFAEAYRLQPTNLDHLRAEWNAAKRIPDEERVIELQKRIREAEDAAAKAEADETAPVEEPAAKQPRPAKAKPGKKRKRARKKRPARKRKKKAANKSSD